MNVDSSRVCEPLTPELALVDSRLREIARAYMPEPPDVFSVFDRRRQARNRLLARWRSLGALDGLHIPLSRSCGRVKAYSLGHVLALGALVVGSLALVASTENTLTVERKRGTRPAVVALDVPRDAVTAVAPPRRARMTAPPTQPRRLAWAPTPGATAYRVVLVRGSKRVFARTTPRPSITVPTRWLNRGRYARLTPGSYRWFVWPILSGRQASTAIVQTSIDVSN